MEILSAMDLKAKQLLEEQQNKIKYGDIEEAEDITILGNYVLLRVSEDMINFKTKVIVKDKVKEGLFKVIKVSPDSDRLLHGLVKPGDIIHTAEVRDYRTRSGHTYFMTWATDIIAVYPAETKQEEENVVE